MNEKTKSFNILKEAKEIIKPMLSAFLCGGVFMAALTILLVWYDCLHKFLERHLF